MKMFGKAYNEVRLKKWIPAINDKWSLHYYSVLEGKMIYSSKSKPPQRCHLRKTVEANLLSGIQREIDYYLIQDQRIAIDVIFDYTKKSSWYIRYYGKDRQIQLLTRKQLADTLFYYKVAD